MCNAKKRTLPKGYNVRHGENAKSVLLVKKPFLKITNAVILCITAFYKPFFVGAEGFEPPTLWV